MAEALAKKILSETRNEDCIKVISAGTSAVDGSPAAKEAVAVMDERGIDLTGHRSRPLTTELVREADLILTMTREQKKWVLNFCPSAFGRVFTLKEYILENQGQGQEFEELAGHVRRLEEKVEDFYVKNGPEIEALKMEYEDYTQKLRKIEEQLLKYEEDFAELTRVEREKIAQLEKGQSMLEVADPFGHGIEVYAGCADELEDNIRKAVQRFLSEIQ